VSFAIFSGILFLSGISALLFQTLWLRLSGLAFGNSVWSAALILSSFMAGLALGNLIAARTRKLRMRPLRLYALLELGVGVFGCTIVFALPHLGAVMHPIFRALWEHQSLLNAFRFAASFAILLVPTTAMGLTLPILLEDPLLKRHEFSRAMGYLYGWNTLGAVTGALLGEFFLVRQFGLLGTGLAAAGINCVAALFALAVGRSHRTRAAESPDATPVSSERGMVPLWRLLSGSFIAGAVLLCLEVVWFRFLRLYLAASPTAFCIMLAVVLAGIGTGGIVAGVIGRRGTRLRHLPSTLALLAALATLLSYLFVPVAAMRGALHDIYLERWWEIAGLSVALMFPASFLSGILFPTIASCVQAQKLRRMNSAGQVTLLNTAGASVGPLVASFLLLPTIGYQRTLIGCAVAYLVLAFVLVQLQGWSVRAPIGWVQLSLLGAFGATLLFFPHGRDEQHFAAARQTFEAYGEHVIAKREGTSDTLQLLRNDLADRPVYYRLVTNDFSMSGTTYQGQRYMRLFAYLPLALRPGASDGLQICYGLGATADSLIVDSPLSHVDVVDISKEVFELAYYDVGPDRTNPLRDPKVTKYIQDGRFFLQATEHRYDVITGEPPPPKVEGTVNLYSQQFFELLKNRLKEGGIATFWLPIYQLKVEETKSILRAFHNAFPTMAVWGSADEEWIMMGINGQPPTLSTSDLRKLFENPATQKHLARIGIEVPQQFPALFLMDGDDVDKITTEVKPLSDLYPKRLGDAPADKEVVHRFAAEYMDAHAAGQRFRDSALMAKIWPASATRSLDGLFLVRETRYHSVLEQVNMIAELDFYVRGTRLRAPVEEALGSNPIVVAAAEKIGERVQPLPLVAIHPLVAGALAARDFPRAVNLLEDLRDRGGAGQDELVLLTYVYCLAGQIEKADLLAQSYAAGLPQGSFRDWFWKKLQTDFGFHPPG